MTGDMNRVAGRMEIDEFVDLLSSELPDIFAGVAGDGAPYTQNMVETYGIDSLSMTVLMQIVEDLAGAELEWDGTFPGTLEELYGVYMSGYTSTSE